MKKGNALNKVFTFHDKFPDRLISRESGWLEFKESFNWSSKNVYAKTLAAFANKKGGYIVFGVRNNPKNLIGLQSNNFEDMDEARISEYFNSIFSPEITFEKLIKEIKGKKVGMLYVHESNYKPVVSIKSDGEIKEAEIYYRYNARTEKIKYPELRILLDEIQKRERQSWMEHLEKISKVGAVNTAVLDIVDGKIEGAGGTLLIDKKLIPKLKFIKEGIFREKGAPTLKLIGNVMPASVNRYEKGTKNIRITTEANAQKINIGENEVLNKYRLDYRALTKKLRKRYIDFKENQKYHELRKEIIKGNTSFIHRRYLDPKNPNSTKKDFYHTNILEEFDKHYRKS